ncbi:hypothetical protein [Thiothrix sp.]|jgi:hypothetical protein|uniref:hypothetical protein n=1 Tax=Thiothrix sp. TaxID=1032 RepID=UPI00258017B3|nr:hypothetical protein [Thiothrix sp.]
MEINPLPLDATRCSGSELSGEQCPVREQCKRYVQPDNVLKLANQTPFMNPYFGGRAPSYGCEMKIERTL